MLTLGQPSSPQKLSRSSSHDGMAVGLSGEGAQQKASLSKSFVRTHGGSEPGAGGVMSSSGTHRGSRTLCCVDSSFSLPINTRTSSLRPCCIPKAPLCLTIHHPSNCTHWIEI